MNAMLLLLRKRGQTTVYPLAEIRKHTLESYTGAKDKERLEHYQASIRTLPALLAKPAVRDQAQTLEFLNVALIGLQQNAWVHGQAVDSALLVQTALQTYEQHHSSASRHALISAYLFQANAELARQNPEYQSLVARTRHSVAPRTLMTFVLERGGPLADLALKNDALRKAVALQKESRTDFPTQVDATDWAMLRRSDSEAAAAIARVVTTDETSKLLEELAFQMNPLSANLFIEQYWTRKMSNDDKGATDLYQKALAEGVPLPPL